ncbi:fibrobacter succinogenes major paralogous domain-containing protein [Tenacibaculum piscium]|uniref:Fibrobacter succinogenes major paralogous domain-containing protein n=1 Tax=Tenacibaculum piscium TaxID=1458515 RepID=A0A2H1YGG8_9FLAO|nr:fibrobacter succinogenes major paralogous domain-containing protein [Tenacibaculum piscium]MBE7630489.1 hypothetical protein [Tenacibaculum piscium]MBE7671676.1 hypothetical protein [Tenacibaculum piscium]MBE7686530.1 hypothetical protein [Tenacibaculum piscium]SOS74568.1 hypothetical protein TNO020_200002 [Tenacibaculum piscium]
MNKITRNLFLIAITLILLNCSNDNLNETKIEEENIEETNFTKPVLETSEIKEITEFTAISGGNITSNGGKEIISRGVCWSINTLPTILDNITSDGSEIGEFKSNISNLKENTNYYLRAYATNSIGTTYGGELSFRTNTSFPNCGDINDIDGNIYSSITIENQCWIKENLNTSKYRNGDIIPQVQNSSEWASLKTGAWCYYENGNGTLTTDRGKIYNWYAVNDVRGLAPEGWHVPSRIEFLKLISNIGGWESAKKLMSKNGWGGNDQTNSTGFSAIPAGIRSGGTFAGSESRAEWWSTSKKSSAQSNTDIFTMFLNNETTIRIAEQEQYDGYTVRCIKD